MSVDEWRARIDAIDRQVLDLLNERAALAVQIGQVKRESAQEVYVAEREQQLLEELVRANPGPLPGEAVQAVWREILSASRAMQRPFRVAYMGPPATFSHLAAMRRFGSQAEYVPVRSIPEVFGEVERGRAEVGVVPVENSTEGAVGHTLDCLIDSDLLIAGEIQLEVQHFLLSRARELGDVKRVYSHPQPLAQCRQWLDRYLRHAETVEVGSTVVAVEHALDDATSAAIAGELAGRLYGLPVLRERIEDSTQNVTRFLVVGRREVGPTGSDKTSVLISIRDEVGALHRILEPFAAARVNLTRIESRPTRRRPWEYVFFIDFQGHRDSPVIREVLAALRERCLHLKVLGSYPAAG